VYNLENLESVGLIKVEKIKYSEKGRQVKIYAPVRKLIVVVPEKTDKKSVAELLKKYLGVLLAAVFASGLIEFLARNANIRSKLVQGTKESLSRAPPLSANATPAAVINETVGTVESYGGTAPTVTSMPAVMDKSVPAVAPSPVAPSATSAVPLNASVTPAHAPIPDGGAAPDILTRMSDTFSAHPGLVFLLGCLFVVMLVVFMERLRKSKNS